MQKECLQSLKKKKRGGRGRKGEGERKKVGKEGRKEGREKDAKADD